MRNDDAVGDLLDRVLVGPAAADTPTAECRELPGVEEEPPAAEGKRRLIDKQTVMLAIATYVLSVVLGWSLVAVMIRLWWGGV